MTDQVFNQIGAVILLISGLAVLFAPQVFARLIQIDMQGARGRAEIRVNVGAFWVGLGAAALYLNQEMGYQVLGIGWAAIFLVRAAAALIDRPRIETTYILLFVGEVITAICLLV